MLKYIYYMKYADTYDIVNETHTEISWGKYSKVSNYEMHQIRPTDEWID